MTDETKLPPGRPPRPRLGPKIELYIPADLRDRLDEHAAEHFDGVRSVAIRDLLREALDARTVEP